jgi:fucose permease
MGFLHAFFGLGAAIGPPGATTALGAGITWRGIFVIVGVLQLALWALVWLRRSQFDGAELHEKHDVAGDVSTGTHRLLLLTLLWFFLIVGLEVSVSAWAFSLLFEERGLAEGVAALWVATFWMAFTAGRVVLGVVGDRMPEEAALWASIAIALAGAGLMWSNPAGLPVGIALPVLGVGISLLFPLMVLITPRWLGPSRAAIATGYQFGAAAVGAVVFSVLIGRLADSRSLEVLGPILFAVAAAAGVVLFLTRTEAARGAVHAVGTG